MPGDPRHDSLPRSGSGPANLAGELENLYGRINYERSQAWPRHFKLDSMRRLLAALGNPHQRYRIVHVAGTKGKGSVCRMIAGALSRSGLRTGRYSSPHIEHISERIEMDGQQIGDRDLADVLGEVRRAAEPLDGDHDSDLPPISFFEAITATALLWFARQQVDFVVLEVGLGGRLDSTNVCHPVLSVITNISLDHTRQLGNAVPGIAREKAGIVKPGIPVISGAIDPLAAREIRETCAVNNSRLLEWKRDFDFQPGGFDRTTMSQSFRVEGRHPAPVGYSADRAADHGPQAESWELAELTMPQAGPHQLENAAVAVAALQVLASDHPGIQAGAIRAALAEFELPGRCEVVCRHPLVVMDMAHNVASVEALVATLRQLTGNRSVACRRLVFASSEDKDLAGMLRILLPEFDEVVFTRFLLNPRATKPELLHEVAGGCVAGNAARPVITVCQRPVEAWARMAPAAGDMTCIAGSAFLIAELRQLVRQRCFGEAAGQAPREPANPIEKSGRLG